MPEPVGVAGIAYLNARPLLAGLEAGIDAPFSYRFESAEPGTCAQRLASGAVGAALVPVASLPSLPGVQVHSGLGVACRGAVTSVLLISKVPPERVATLAIHRASRSAVTLARLLLTEKFGVRPHLVTVDPPLANMLANADATVIIGDPAMRVAGQTGLCELDLAAAWNDWTGLPFVFAVWALSPVAPTTTSDLLVASHAHARAHWEELLTRWAQAHGRTIAEVRTYLEQILHFELNDADRAGMAEFLRRAATADVLPTAVSES
ncbi:MAG: menaquinone biosynthesis protein [Thermoanaerobaculaceae bacterium]|nr:menaquinone biosynthesis protein [Thermoanaerobaculaceae bacterium]MDI9622436.1 menaquinone biosynthesis protein [Acidobacteriota bacterium]NLH11191.1 menaquinone biosynthesis protein [Holophagae bacterium]HPW54337.1 menaquinone biosynthesis protein [Thermoanaerobaculaceae bacterium]